MGFRFQVHRAIEAVDLAAQLALSALQSEDVDPSAKPELVIAVTALADARQRLAKAKESESD